MEKEHMREVEDRRKILEKLDIQYEKEINSPQKHIFCAQKFSLTFEKKYVIIWLGMLCYSLCER